MRLLRNRNSIYEGEIMNYAIQGTIFLIFISGAVLFWKSAGRSTGTRSAKSKLDQYRAALKGGNPETDHMVQVLGIRSGTIYQIIRYAILTACLGTVAYTQYPFTSDALMPFTLWLIAFAVTSPRRTLFNKDSPFYILVKLMQKRKKQKLNIEIYRCFSQLKNIAVAKSDVSYSADFIICELAKYSNDLKPIFNRMLGYWYEGRYEDAAGYFKESVGTKEAEALASILLKIDYLKPAELVSQIELYQDSVKNDRRTAAQKEKENQSNLIYVLVMASGIIIFVNLIVVVIGVDYKLSNFFSF